MVVDILCCAVLGALLLFILLDIISAYYETKLSKEQYKHWKEKKWKK